MNYLMPHVARHILIISLLICYPPSLTEGRGGAIEFADKAAAGVIAEYRSDDPSARVKDWQTEITHPSGNPNFKEFQDERLREWEKSEFAPHRLDDPEVVRLLTEVIRPVLALYGRERCFKLLVIDHRVPVAMNDSAVLLMFSTGLIERASSDDEVLAHAAHEVAHDLFWRRTAKAHERLELCKGRGAAACPAAQKALAELYRIELESDAVASVTLAALNRNPGLFGQYLLEIERDFPSLLNLDLPACSLRARVINGVVPGASLTTVPRTTPAFLKLKALLKTLPRDRAAARG